MAHHLPEYQVHPSLCSFQVNGSLFDGSLSDQAAAAIDDLILSVKKTKKKKTLGTEMVRQMSPGGLVVDVSWALLLADAVRRCSHDRAGEPHIC